MPETLEQNAIDALIAANEKGQLQEALAAGSRIGDLLSAGRHKPVQQNLYDSHPDIFPFTKKDSDEEYNRRLRAQRWYRVVGSPGYVRQCGSSHIPIDEKLYSQLPPPLLVVRPSPLRNDKVEKFIDSFGFFREEEKDILRNIFGSDYDPSIGDDAEESQDQSVQSQPK